MKINRKFKTLLYKTLLLCLGWFIVALWISTMTFLNQIQGNFSQSLSTLNVILFEVTCIIPWAVSTPFIIWATNKYRLEGEAPIKAFSVHFLAMVVIFTFHSIVQSYAVSVFYQYAFSWSYVQRDFVGFLDMRLMLYTSVVLGVCAINFHQKTRESKLREPRLKAQLNDARYHALLNQVQPTFLLNSIDDIRENVRNNPDESEEILTRFSDLLRIMLQNATREEVIIKKDLRSYYLYLYLLEKRFGITIEKKTDINQECYEAMVPAYLVYLLLILLIEEIVLTEPKKIAEIKRVHYSAKRTNDMTCLIIKIEELKLTSTDLNKYLGRSQFEDIRQRLRRKYGNSIALKIRTAGKTLQMSFQIPFRTEKTDEPSFIGKYNGNPENELVS